MRTLSHVYRDRGSVVSFKIVGSKSRVAAHIAGRIPDVTGRRYFEPFMGGAAVYRSLRARGDKASLWALSDSCPHTTMAMLSIQNDVDALQQDLEALVEKYNGSEDKGKFYLRMRDEYNAQPRAALHIFLRQSSFNGLWRVSQAGRFNVPWGKYEKMSVPDFSGWHESLQGAQIRHRDFRDAFGQIDEGDVVYADPPYRGEFASYTRQGFSDEDHKDLLKCCAGAHQRGAHVVLSNVGNYEYGQMVKSHWPDAEIYSFPARQTMAARAAKRRPIMEFVYVGKGAP